MEVETKEYNVIVRFREHGKGWHEASEVVEMTEPEARYLKLSGHVEVKKETSTKTSKAKAEAEG
ncbi:MULTISPECIES: hypothetical protein [unclassified Maridesulfovibrio]|uniref:hypothetical protein n=1 Tax=unclassified Maridesulfovibrio TaxID=2794999 RepID=UPI003B41F386